MSNPDHAGLTPAEVEALSMMEDEDTTATQGDLEDKATTTTAATKGNDDADDDTDEGAGKDGGAAAAAGDDAGAGAATADDGKAAAPAAAEPSPAASQPAQQAPILVAQAPADAEAQLADIKTQKADLRKKYDDGDLTFDEYEQQKEELDDKRMEITRAVEKAQIASEMEQQRAKNQWDTDCANFLTTHAAVYDGEANKEAFEHLNETIIAYAKMPRNAGLTGPQLLDKAHKAVMAERGTPVVEAKPETKPAAKAAVPKPALPPDMSRLPASSSNDPAEGKWASLDKLQTTNPGAYEDALAKMSDADRDAYLAA